MKTEVLYLTWNRLAFTQVSLHMLLREPLWERVERLVVYDDGSEDGTVEWVRDRLSHAGVAFELRERDFKSPPATMNDYLNDVDSSVEVFVKVDNDIVGPPGWINVMLDVLADNPELELIGAEAGQPDQLERPLPYSYEPCTHVGGIGAFRVSAFKRSMTRMKEDGRFGFQEHQQIYRMTRGWVTPDLHVLALDRVPFEPFRSLSAGYVDRGWQREWWCYEDSSPHLDWFRELGASDGGVEGFVRQTPALNLWVQTEDENGASGQEVGLTSEAPGKEEAA